MYQMFIARAVDRNKLVMANEAVLISNQKRPLNIFFIKSKWCWGWVGGGGI